MMKFIIDKNIPYIATVFENFGDVWYLSADQITSEVVCDADVLIVRTRTKCDEALLVGSSVKMIATATIGLDHVDTDYCDQHGIYVTNCAGCNADAVAQWVFAALRELGELKSGSVFGIVGVGNVGKSVERVALERGMRVLKCDPPRANREGCEGFVQLEELLSKSDIVTMHVPLDQTTVGMCDEAFFSTMNGKVFLNASRGEVVDEGALKGAIECGRVEKCALDVWCAEPNIDRELIGLIDIATPHIAGYSARGKANATRMVVRAVAEFYGLAELKNWLPDVHPRIEIPEEYNIMADDVALRSGVEFEKLRTNYNYR